MDHPITAGAIYTGGAKKRMPLNILNGGANSNNGTIFVLLKPWDERKTAEERLPGLIGVIQGRISKAGIKNANVVVVAPPPIRGIGRAAGFSMQIEQGIISELKDDPSYVPLFRGEHYYIILIAKHSLLGPLSKNQNKAIRKDLGIPDDIKLESDSE